MHKRKSRTYVNDFLSNFGGRGPSVHAKLDQELDQENDQQQDGGRSAKLGNRLGQTAQFDLQRRIFLFDTETCFWRE
jgi:hypothetical protein